MECPRCHIQTTRDEAENGERCNLCGTLYFEQTIHPVIDDPDLPPMYWLVPGDGSRGYLVGELWQVRQVVEKLTALVEQGNHDGELDQDDERIAVWLTPDEAARMAGINVKARMIRRACQNGLIEGAKPDPWRFSLRALRRWRRSQAVTRRGHKPSSKS